MNNRRSFLKILGLGAVAAPAVGILAIEAEPVSAVAINAKYREINRRLIRLRVSQWTTDEIAVLQRGHRPVISRSI